jgi:hypothetical protein
VRRPPDDWPEIDADRAISCLYDETTVAPPEPIGPITFKNQEKVSVLHDGQNKSAVVMANRTPKDPANIIVKIGTTQIEVPRDTVRKA